jgi:hypothetical protein
MTSLNCEIQCCAIGYDNKRCGDLISNGSHHCDNHYPKAIKLYKTYKKICDVAYNLDLYKIFENQEEHIMYINECYDWLNKAYHARMAHRVYAFVPECYDEGHDFQFKFIQKKISICENILEKIYQEKQNKYNSQTDNLNKSKKKRKDVEEDVNTIMDRYIKENQEIIRKRNSLIKLVIKTLEDLFDNQYEETSRSALVLFGELYNLSKELYYHKYFHDDFEPPICDACKEIHYVAVPVRLGCSCILNNESISMYFNKMIERNLKIFYELLIKHSAKFKGVIPDLIQIYKIYDYSILTLKLETIWVPELARMKIRESQEKEEFKLNSKYYQQQRLKKSVKKNLGIKF